jgi:hypothetical protein
VNARERWAPDHRDPTPETDVDGKRLLEFTRERQVASSPLDPLIVSTMI